MSLAVELWRALEAWNPERHPRGPGGKFAKLGGGGGHDRPSLADAVSGTASAGPKRQRKDKAGMSVADAVRHAARQSDTTGRPTQRPVEEHRAHGAHDVADEVDRALAEAGVSEEVRAAVSGRARARAEKHGPRPTSLPHPPRPALPEPKAKASQAEIQGEIHDAVRSALAGRSSSDWASLADVRQHLGDRHSRADVDAALTGLLDTEGVRIIPIANTKALKPRDREAAVRLGGEDHHAIQIRGNVPRPVAHPAPAPTVAAPSIPAAGVKRQRREFSDADAQAVHDRLNAATSLAQAREHLAGLTAQQLKKLAAHSGVSVRSKDTKPRLIDALVNGIAGRRLDSAALSRM